MARTCISLATVYSSAQCILSVVGSVGVILLFAGIPQLIYSPVVSAANLITFVMGAVLIMIMVAGNTLLNYKFRRLDRDSEGSVLDGNNGSQSRPDDPEDKPPSYETLVILEEPPPEYASIIPQKPPKYEEIAKQTYAACGQEDSMSVVATHDIPMQALAEGSVTPQNQEKIFTVSRALTEDVEDERAPQIEQNIKSEAAAAEGSARANDEEQDESEPASQSLSSRERHCVVSEASRNTNSQFPGESET